MKTSNILGRLFFLEENKAVSYDNTKMLTGEIQILLLHVTLMKDSVLWLQCIS